MKKMLAVLFVAVLLGGIFPAGHVHDENCGYDPKTNSGCVYDQISPLNGGRYGD